MSFIEADDLSSTYFSYKKKKKGLDMVLVRRLVPELCFLKVQACWATRPGSRT